jgi:hypothetical protein
MDDKKMDDQMIDGKKMEDILAIRRDPGSPPRAELQFFTHAGNSRFYAATREGDCEIEKVEEIAAGEGEVGHEIHSVVCSPDAQIAWLVLCRDLEGRGVVITFGRDPCA